MPWDWGKKESQPPISSPESGTAASRLEEPIPSLESGATDPPVAGPVTFRIDDVYTIKGEGCVAVGQVVDGILRPPTTMRLVTSRPRPEAPFSVEVVKVTARRKAVGELASGTPAGLTLRGVEVDGYRAHTFLEPRSLTGRWPVQKGDRLESP
jgi:translation elongation factor EF-Tu-like GTPase